VRLLSVLLAASWPTVTVAAIAAVAGGAAGAGLVAVSNAALHRAGGPSATLAAGFMALCVVLLVSRIVSRVLLVRLAQDAVLDLRLRLTRRILAAPLRQLEETGAPRLLAMLTDDVLAVSDALPALPILGTNMATVAACLAYLGWLSWQGLAAVVAVLGVGTLGYRLVVRRALRAFSRAREEQDALFAHLRALTEGIKELKTRRARREAYLREMLGPTATAYRDHAVRGRTLYTAAGGWAQVLFFVVVGVLVFALPARLDLPGETVTGYTLTFFYMMAPLDVIMNWLPFLGRANVAVGKVEALGLSLGSAGEPEADGTAHISAAGWSRLDLVGVAHAYHHEREDRSFTLGPIDLTLRPGEVLFVVGGNGSGKTTLAKLLTGLYAPESGEIRVDGEPVTDATRVAYRERFSVVYADGFLFDRLLGLTSGDLDARARDYLSQLQLDHKVEVADGRLSTIALSQGQRRRLALLVAYLEDRPIYVFDEWASDQDPFFKAVFYRQILPELKRRGKAVVVISHDDRYYDAADRIVKLESGRIVAETVPSAAGGGAPRLST
jgi:putative ATP-binding cassette transporter